MAKKVFLISNRRRAERPTQTGLRAFGELGELGLLSRSTNMGAYWPFCSVLTKLARCSTCSFFDIYTGCVRWVCICCWIQFYGTTSIDSIWFPLINRYRESRAQYLVSPIDSIWFPQLNGYRESGTQFQVPPIDSTWFPQTNGYREGRTQFHVSRLTCF